MNNNGELRSYAPTPPHGQAVKKYRQGVLPEGQQRELLHGYYAAVSFIDSLVDDLLKELKKTGRADNTIIVVWGDHGFHLGDHGLWGKHTTMEQANRVPLLIYAPGLKGGYAASPVELLDLFPTLGELSGLPVPEHLQGDSLLPLLQNPALDIDDVAISQYKRAGAYGYTMRTKRYRYTEWRTANKKRVYRDLYDLVEDPGETVNIGGLPENQQLMQALEEQLRENSVGLNRL
jgi:arylsulfatase A-like enzyme